MLHGKVYADYYENDYFQAVTLELLNNSLIIIVPKGDIGDAKLTEEAYNDLTTTKNKEYVDYKFPQFKLEGEKEDFQEILKSFGITDAFDEQDADLSNIFKPKDGIKLYVGSIAQQCYFDVNRYGVEAAAVTSAEIPTGTSSSSNSEIIYKTLTADKPFYFVLTNNATDSILFLGVVYNP